MIWQVRYLAISSPFAAHRPQVLGGESPYYPISPEFSSLDTGKAYRQSTHVLCSAYYH